MSLGVWFARLPQGLARGLYPLLRYTNLMRAIEMRQLAPWVRDVRGWRVLDVGCGSGFYSLDFARRGAELVGCDLSLPALGASLLTGRGLGLDGRATYLQADGSTLPFDDEAFDLVFCNCVLEHVQEDREALGEMRRTLRPGGLLYLTADSADKRLMLGFLERLPARWKRFLLRPEVANAPTVVQGLDDYLAGIYAVRRRYHRQPLQDTLHELGFDVLDSRAYISLLGAVHYEAFRLARGVDPRYGLSRLVHMLTSFLLYPWVVLLDTLQRKEGYGLTFVLRKGSDRDGYPGRRPATQHAALPGPDQRRSVVGPVPVAGRGADPPGRVPHGPGLCSPGQGLPYCVGPCGLGLLYRKGRPLAGATPRLFGEPRDGGGGLLCGCQLDRGPHRVGRRRLAVAGLLPGNRAG
jgi:ubiquinone/menaquinone biosynthesis C-methylase UbiE